MSGFSVAPGAIVLAQSAVAVPLTGSTSETTLATITIPAGAMGANGRVEIKAMSSNNNSAGTKTLKIKFGGTTIFSPASTTTLQQQVLAFVANRNATNSQVAPATGSFGTGTGSSANVTAAVDTTASVDIVITGQLSVGTDNMSLESYQVILYPKG